MLLKLVSKVSLLFACCFLGVYSHVRAQALSDSLFSAPPLYLANRTSDMLAIDGRADESAWNTAPWLDNFGDIVDHRQDGLPKTRVKILWDESYVYVYAELEERDIWATFREQDSRVFMENAFEIFIDADGNGHDYVELQINALGTVWDLLMTKPYRNKGNNVSDWDIKGLKKAVAIRGTINDPLDSDTAWAVELAIPVASVTFGGDNQLKEGLVWRVNFSRVQWDIAVLEDNYVKVSDAIGAPKEPYYMVWTPQGAVNLHMPERWGYVVFVDGAENSRPEMEMMLEDYRQIEGRIWKVYYLQEQYKSLKGGFADSLEQLKALFPEEDVNSDESLSMLANRYHYWIWYTGQDGKPRVSLDQDGLVSFWNAKLK